MGDGDQAVTASAGAAPVSRTVLARKALARTVPNARTAPPPRVGPEPTVGRPGPDHKRSREGKTHRSAGVDRAYADGPRPLAKGPPPWHSPRVTPRATPRTTQSLRRPPTASTGGACSPESAVSSPPGESLRRSPRPPTRRFRRRKPGAAASTGPTRR